MTDIMKKKHNVTIIGHGEKTLIFAHGFGADQTMWKKITPFFEKDYKILLFDHVGSGNSDNRHYNEEKHSTLQGYAEDLLSICEAYGIEDSIYVGHSVSAMIGLLASIKAPHHFSKQVMIGPSPRYLNDLPDYQGGFEEEDIEEILDMMEMNFEGWASYLAPVAMNKANSPALVSALERSFLDQSPMILRNFLEVTLKSDYREELGKSEIPTLIIQCAEDSFVPYEVGKYIHAHLPESTLHLMNEAKGHYPHLSHPKETADIIQRYLN